MNFESAIYVLRFFNVPISKLTQPQITNFRFKKRYLVLSLFEFFLFLLTDENELYILKKITLMKFQVCFTL